MAINVSLCPNRQWVTIYIGDYQIWQGYVSDLSANMQEFIKQKV